MCLYKAKNEKTVTVLENLVGQLVSILTMGQYILTVSPLQWYKERRTLRVSAKKFIKFKLSLVELV